MGILTAVFALLTPSGLAVGRAGAEESPPAATGGCAAAPVPPGRSVAQFTAAGRSGAYVRDVPPEAHGPLPVVFDLHGYMEPAAVQHATSGFGEYGMARGFVTVTPQLAIAPVAGVQDFPWCDTSRPVPVIAFHGTADPIVAYTGGRGPTAHLAAPPPTVRVRPRAGPTAPR
ncbi:alpha/beta hydrolase family protein [Nocardia sp. X0981]